MDQLIDMGKDFITEKLMDMAKDFITEKPGADVTDVRLKHGDRNALSLESDVLVSNPYSHDLPICEISFTMKIGSR